MNIICSGSLISIFKDSVMKSFLKKLTRKRVKVIEYEVSLLYFIYKGLHFVIKLTSE